MAGRDGASGDDDTSSDAARLLKYRTRSDRCYNKYLSSTQYAAATMLQLDQLPISTVTPAPNKTTHQVDATHSQNSTSDW